MFCTLWDKSFWIEKSFSLVIASLSARFPFLSSHPIFGCSLFFLQRLLTVSFLALTVVTVLLYPHSGVETPGEEGTAPIAQRRIYLRVFCYLRNGSLPFTGRCPVETQAFCSLKSCQDAKGVQQKVSLGRWDSLTPTIQELCPLEYRPR